MNAAAITKLGLTNAIWKYQSATSSTVLRAASMTLKVRKASDAEKKPIERLYHPDFSVSQRVECLLDGEKTFTPVCAISPKPSYTIVH